MDFEDDIEEGTVVASATPSNSIAASVAPLQVKAPEDSNVLENGDSDSEKSQASFRLPKPTLKNFKLASIDFGTISTFRQGLQTLPTVNLQTVDSNTFDLDLMLSTKAQRRAQGGHRFAMSPSPSGRMSSPKNFISANKSQAGKYGYRLPVGGYSVPISPKPTSNCDVQERFWDKLERTQNRLQEQRIDKDRSELADCTFVPMTNMSSNYIRRSNSEFAQSVDEFLKTKASKIEDMRREQFSLTVDTRAFTPSLCSRSRSIVQRRGLSTSSVYDRLVKRKRSILEMKLDRLKDQEVFSYIPTINFRSANHSRTQSVDDLNYSSSKSRNLVESKFRLDAKAKKTDAILLKKLLDDFEAATQHYEGDSLNYTQVKEVMVKLSFAPPEGSDSVVQMWKVLQAKGRTHKDSMLQVLGAALRVNVPLKYIQKAPKLTDAQKKKLYHQFRDFYLHKTGNAESSKRLQDRFESPSFRPKIDEKSQKLQAKVYHSRKGDSAGGSIGEALHKEHAKITKKIEAKRRDKEVEDNKECSFKPTFVARPSSSMGGSYGSEALYQHSKEQQKSRAEKKELAEAQRELKETEGCTFSPIINDRFAKAKGLLPEQAKVVHRLRTARAERLAKESEKEKGMTPRELRPGLKMLVDYTPKQASLFNKKPAVEAAYSKKGRTTSTASLFSSLSTSAGLSRVQSQGTIPASNSSLSRVSSSTFTRHPQSDLLSPAEEEEIMLSLKVNISPTLSDTLTILEGEDSQAVLEAFIKKHRLGAKESVKLKKYVDSHVVQLP